MKRKLKKLVPYILIIIGVALLGVVLAGVLQFTYKDEMPDDPSDPEPQVQEPIIKTYNFTNESNMTKEQVIDETYTEEDNEKYMVLTDEFANNLKRFVTLDLVTSLTKNFEILNTIGDTIYYKVSKDEFNPLHDQSAIANFNYTGIEFFPTYADDELIAVIMKIMILLYYILMKNG